MAGTPDSGPAETGPDGAGPPLARWHLLWLGSLTLIAVFFVLEPLGTFAVFGSDTGEYFRLTSDLLTTGRLPASGYSGWGTAYPDFPGIFLLAGATAGALGVDTFDSLVIGIPVVAALSVVPLFLLFRRLVPHNSVALLGAAFAAVYMPRLFSIAHPAPLSLGDFLCVAALWMFVEGRRDSRFYLPLALASGALIVTHHLSSYFFLVSAAGGLVLLELWRPGSWSTRFPLRELVFVGGFSSVLFAYWFVYSPQFIDILETGLPSVQRAILVPLVAGAWLLLVAAGITIRWRRRGPRPVLRVRYPSSWSVGRDMAIILVGTLAGIGLITVVPLPGTSQKTALAAVVFFLPLLLSLALTAGTRRLVTFSRLSPFSIAWMTAVGLSAMLALAVANPELPATRHAEYLLIPVGLLVALGTGHLVGRWAVPSGRGAIAAGVVAATVILAANAAIAYPPPSVFGGFQEGLTTSDAALWMWVGVGLPGWAVLASDHRLSSMVFGFDGNPATWDSTLNLFTGDNWSLAAADLHSSVAPHVAKPVNAVAIDLTMRSGVALDPSASARPMSPEALAWLSAPPFVPLYESGAQVVYWVDGPVAATG
ncbi:MAG TPA: hypothetical protein VEY07_06920 [Thermoplasmata archaeon]|nr:hypothetical protein [Thermoplasmata archaeon]